MLCWRNPAKFGCINEHGQWLLCSLQICIVPGTICMVHRRRVWRTLCRLIQSTYETVATAYTVLPNIPSQPNMPPILVFRALEVWSWTVLCHLNVGNPPRCRLKQPRDVQHRERANHMWAPPIIFSDRLKSLRKRLHTSPLPRRARPIPYIIRVLIHSPHEVT